MKILYSEEALWDLVRLREFVAIHDEEIAERVANDILLRIEALASFPQLGHLVTGITTTAFVRDFIFGSYHVRYFVRSDTLIILRIWHTREHR